MMYFPRCGEADVRRLCADNDMCFVCLRETQYMDSHRVKPPVLDAQHGQRFGFNVSDNVPLGRKVE